MLRFTSGFICCKMFKNLPHTWSLPIWVPLDSNCFFFSTWLGCWALYSTEATFDAEPLLQKAQRCSSLHDLRPYRFQFRSVLPLHLSSPRFNISLSQSKVKQEITIHPAGEEISKLHQILLVEEVAKMLNCTGCQLVRICCLSG